MPAANGFRPIVLNKPDWMQSIERGIGLTGDVPLCDACDSVRTQMKRLVSDEPAVSVVIPAYNEMKRQYLLASLASLARQQTTLALQVIVVDNASQDDTPELASRCGAEVVFEARKSIPFARQAGLEAAKAPLVCCTDADTRVPPTWVASIANRFASSPGLAALVGDIRYFDPKLSFFYYRYGMDRLKDVLGMAPPADAPFFTGANLSYRRDQALAVGGYTGIQAYGEDRTMALRLAQVGELDHDFSPQATVYTSARRLNQRPLSRQLIDMLFSNLRERVLGNEVSQEELQAVYREQYRYDMDVR